MTSYTRILLASAFFLAISGSAFSASASSLSGTACATGTNGDTSVIGQTRMDTNSENLVVCLCIVPTSAGNNNICPTGDKFWKSMSGLLGTSNTMTSPAAVGDLTTGLYSPATGEVAISTSGIESVVVNPNGNPFGYVGINTTTPRTPLEIDSPYPAVGDIGFGGWWGDFWYDGGTDGYFPIENVSPLESGGTAFVRNPNWDGDIQTLLYIGNNATVGVETASPQATLDVNGEVRVGTTGTGCTAQNVGAIRYNSGTFEGCDGSGTWKTFSLH